MQKFKDKKGTDWTISLDIGMIEEIEGTCDVNLFEPVGEDDTQVIAKIAPLSSENIKRFVNMLYLMCREQCDEHGVTDTQFGRLLGGDGLSTAYDAFYAEWMSFFQSLGRPDMAEAIKASMGILPQAMEEVAKKIKELAEELKGKTLKEMEELVIAKTG